MMNVEHTSDQVYVVRCSECKWIDEKIWNDENIRICILHWVNCGPDFYCKDGEKRDGKEDHSS